MERACNEEICSRGGTFNSNLGICLCKYNEVCNETCHSNRPKCSVQRQLDGILTVTYIGNNGDKVAINVTQEIGVADHDNDEHICEFLVFAEDSASGALPKSLLEASALLSSSAASSEDSSRRKRRAVELDSDVLVPNPSICLEYGQALTFRVQINAVNRSLSHYPRYRKNHLLNKNDEFDFGNFRRLHSIVQETNQTLNVFVHTFRQNGTFVFYDNANPFRETVVRVMAQGSECPNARMSSITEAALASLGIKTSKVRISEIRKLFVASTGEYGSRYKL